MTISYKCKKCEFSTKNKYDMVKHLNKKKICIPSSISKYDLSEEENRIESLKPIYSYNFDENGLKCPNCSKCLKTNKTLNIHVKNCKIVNENIINDNETIIETNKNSPLENNTNQTEIKNNLTNIINNDNSTVYNINNINNITNINFNPIVNINLLDFKDDWKTDHIDEIVKKVILLCQNKFSNLLIEILKNDVNHNVVIDKNSINAYVYNKEKMDFEIKNRELIIEETLNKLKYQLLNLTSEINNGTYTFDYGNIDKAIKEINHKYQRYKICNKKNKKEIDDVFINIYDNNKQEIAKNYNIKKKNELNAY
jgi:hypothetical protein